MKKIWTRLALIALLTLALCVTAMASDGSEGYVLDMTGLLEDQQWGELEQKAETISQRFGCGVYIVILDDYEDYGSGEIYDVTAQIYHDAGFGVGGGRNGILLLLSMDERDYAMFVYGEKAEDAFNGYGQQLLEETFLDDFKVDSWYGGFSDYLSTCDEYLAEAERGQPVRESPTVYIVFVIIGALLLALIVCMILKQGMRTVHQQAEASEYMVGSVNVTESSDQFTHMTETSRKIEKSSESSSGGGGSGRSGKF